MNPVLKQMVYILSGVLFLFSFSGMLVYGYKTFYIAAEQPETQDYAYHFVLIAEEKDNEYWRLVEKGAKEQAEENDVYLEYVAPQKADNDEMLVLLDRMISAKVDGIMIQGVNGQRFVDLVHKGIERGIPIITVDTDVKSSERKAYVGTDNYYAGQLMGQTLIKHTSEEQHVGIVTGRFDAISQQERIEGLKYALESVPRIHIADIKESNITAVGASQAAYDLIKQNPQITALAGTSALDGPGIVEGLNEIAPNRNVFITAFDILPRTLELIKQDHIDATIAQYPEEIGHKALNVMLKLQSNDLVENEIFTETRVIQKKDLQTDHSGGIQ
ncbi:hypothetical protein JNUCC1_01092 [Lentibacillus sp. JNUCC-1]|uniref:substrate-binding domain-containing protein n=1 Tax=Lentibacillus sp. JNUCC-1 TaxID=2654513 RepID=UPI0012E794A3|nr:substrate-binding domain-containing protein [Lentibacillus sp. JNUCC-1]MUV37286.1 hypothetical protein [Lentibacillus sp. JNUCC-1]